MMAESRDDLADFLGGGENEEARPSGSSIGKNVDEEASGDGLSISGGGDRLRELEEEQERLNGSMLALSTHFAQVQFRLKQVAAADAQQQPILLKELQEFAFRGCPDLAEVKGERRWHTNALDQETSEEHEAIMLRQAQRRSELIAQLKEQLSDLEHFVYDTDNGQLPSSLVLEKQKTVIDQLHDRIQLNLQLETMSNDDLQEQVDAALKQLVNPIKVKEQLVSQLQTQIEDLERFVQFIQTESPTPPDKNKSTSINGSALVMRSSGLGNAAVTNNPLLSLLGCQSRRFHRNQLKTTKEGGHYGDSLAQLEIAVDALDKLQMQRQLLTLDEVPSNSAQSMFSDEKIDEELDRCEEQCVRAVRKQLCPALRAVLEHGMLSVVAPSMASSASAFGCFPARSAPRRSLAREQEGSTNQELRHIWDVIVYYYEQKKSGELSEATVRKLSQSFKLETVGGRSLTSRQVLLSTIETVIASHGRLKRSADAMWKALVSVALNERRLGGWLRIIFKSREVSEQCFAYNAFVRTGSDDIYQLLERLQKYHFLLPADLAVRPFHQMKDAF